MAPRRRVVIHLRAGREAQGFFYSPYTGRVDDFRGVPPGANSLATLIRVAFSGGLVKTRFPRLIPLGQRVFFCRFIDQRARFVRHLQHFRPGPVIIFAGQFARRVKTHVRADVLLGRRVIQRVARVLDHGRVARRDRCSRTSGKALRSCCAHRNPRPPRRCIC